MKYACAIFCLTALFLPSTINGVGKLTRNVHTTKRDSVRSSSLGKKSFNEEKYTTNNDQPIQRLSKFSEPSNKKNVYDTYNHKWNTHESNIEGKYQYPKGVEKTNKIRYNKRTKRQLSDEAKDGTTEVTTEDLTTTENSSTRDSTIEHTEQTPMNINDFMEENDRTAPPFDVLLESRRYITYLSSPDTREVVINLYGPYDDLPPPLVNTTAGVIVGRRNRKYGLSYLSFEGVPYASVPERFQAPKPPVPWDGIRNATVEAEPCSQHNLVSGGFIGKEDCLNLNIYTPSVEDKGRPVLVVVHGGGFNLMMGTRLLYGPEHFNNEEIIVVMFNYRLGALGFLATLTPDAPGNAGMKDMIALLAWVQNNIKKFGGDPNKVTLFGSSSGSAAVEYLTITKMAKGLFSKVIMQSGSALNYFFYDNDPIKYAFRLGSYMGFHTNDVKKLVEHLKAADIVDLVYAAQRLGEDVLPIGINRPFTPCIENLIPGEKIFLHDYPENILKAGDFIQVPSMIGYNSLEGSEFIKGILVDPEYINTIDNTLEYLIPPDLTNTMDRPQKRKALIDKVRKFYFKGERISNATAKNLVELIGDQLILYGLFKSVNIRSQKSEQPIYFWEMAFDGELGIFRKYLSIGVEGAGHADELGYLFNVPLFDGYPLSNHTREVSQRLVKMVANFMKYGNPTPATTELLPVIWEPLDGNSSLKYLRISEKMEMMKDPHPYDERVAFWSDLYAHKNDAV